MKDGNEGVKLLKPLCERDLGVYVDSELCFEYHITKIAKKEHQMASLLWRTFQYIDEDMFKTLYKTIIRSHLQYAAPVWSPYTWKLTEEMEKVQRRATKRVPSLVALKYEERVRKLKLPTLIFRRIRDDLINVYKYMNNIYDINVDLLPLEKIQNQKPQQENKETPFQAKTPPLLLLLESHWLVEQAAQRSGQRPSVDSFKNRLDHHFRDHPMFYDYTEPWTTLSRTRYMSVS